MAGVYHQRHPERSVFYRVFFHYFDRFLLEYENRFEREYGYLRPVIQEVVDKYLDYGNPKCGFARIFFKYKRSLLSGLCLCGKGAILKYLRAVTGKEIIPGIIAVIQSFGSKINLSPTCTFFSQREEKIKKGSSINYLSLMRA